MAVLLVALAACGGSSAQRQRPPAVQNKQLNVDGLNRSYRLFAPLTLERDQPTPLLLVLHGVGDSGEGMVGATQLDGVASREDFIVAYPDGINQTWNGGYCCLGRAKTGPDDVAFLARVINDVQAEHNVDPARVFVVGVSAGAIMAYRLGCELAGRINGVASVAGAMVLDAPTHEGGVCHRDPWHRRPPRSFRWRENRRRSHTALSAHECGRWALGRAEPLSLASCQRDRGASHHLDLDRLLGGTAVKLITVEGGGHTWFGPGFGAVDGAIDATGAIVEFFGLRPKPRQP